MRKVPATRGNYVSDWFGQRIFPRVRLREKDISGANFGVCPFLTAVKREKTVCVKSDNAFGVCTISSVGSGKRRDWLVCPYRVIDSTIVDSACEAIFRSDTTISPIPVSILREKKGIELLDRGLRQSGRAFVFFQDKLGGEISISGTTSSPEMAFDVTVVEISRMQKGFKVGRYGFIEIQTMDFHGSYRAAVSNLRDAHRLHRDNFPQALAQNLTWLSQNVEGPNIANVFKRTFYQTLLKFELSKEGAAAGTVLAVPSAVWESWQPFLGNPVVEHVKGSEFRVLGADNKTYHGTNAWIFVFDLDGDSKNHISPVKITAKIRVSATDLVEHAFVTVPKNMLQRTTSDDVLLSRIRERIRRVVPTIVVQ
jgi:hypothetical protein